jgi:hypothetical protein
MPKPKKIDNCKECKNYDKEHVANLLKKARNYYVDIKNIDKLTDCMVKTVDNGEPTSRMREPSLREVVDTVNELIENQNKLIDLISKK